jgi:isopenicillin N synthase-like dioxygenase
MGSESVPVIDIADLDRAVTRRAIDDACCEWGFFQIANHGIDEALTSALKEQMRQFFALPLANKQAIQRTAENSWGYYDRELTRHTPDWKQVYDYGPPDGGRLIPQWPAELPRFQAVIQAYYEACDAVALRLLHVLAGNLGMPEDSLDTLFRPEHTSFLRLNYYPKCPTPVRPRDVAVASGGYLGVNHHTDAGALTLLLQDRQPGLEVLNEGAWKLVEPRTDTLVVNLGDIAQVWSNDRYRAALHRGLANAEAERFSAPFFFNPTYAADYAPLSSTIDERHPPRYRPINWGEFRSHRTAGDYANYGDYHQISHYAQ